MAGLDPATHVLFFLLAEKDVDPRVKPAGEEIFEYRADLIGFYSDLAARLSWQRRGDTRLQGRSAWSVRAIAHFDRNAISD